MAADDARNATSIFRRLIRLMAGLQGAMDEPRIAEVVVDHCVDAIQAQSAGLWIVEEGHVTLLRSHEYSAAAAELVGKLSLSADSPICSAARERRALFFSSRNDFAAAFPDTAERSKDMGCPAGGTACVPIVRSDVAIAVMSFTWAEARSFGVEEREYLELIAVHVAEALERTRLFAAERRARTRFEILFALVEEVSRAASLEQAFEPALDAVIRALGAEQASILLLDEHGEMRFHAWRGLSERYREAVEGHSPWRPDEPNPKPIFYADVMEDDAMAAYRPYFAEEGIRAIGFVPLVHERRLIGKFMVYASSPRKFSSDDIVMAVALATALAHAIARRKAQEEVVLARDAAIAAARARADIVAVVAHDLRNPLNVAKLKMQIMSMRAKDGQTLKDLAVIGRSLDHMNRLIGGLLDVATIEADRMTFDLQRHPAAEVVEEAIELVRTLADERSIKIVPPPSSGGECVLCDKPRILQVLSNLLGNAIRFSPERGFVVVTVEPEGESFVRFSVTDEGPGIPLALRERVFERYVHGEKKSGLGLGLFIAKGIVSGHGGRIRVEDAPGSGARVAFTLPRA